MTMNLKYTMLALVAAVSVQNVQAMDAAAAKALASKSACMSCHAVDRKLVGPSYKDVAAKHKGEAGAVDKVAARIKSGGSGMYGPIPMPAQPNLKPDELKLLAQWILAGAPDK